MTDELNDQDNDNSNDVSVEENIISSNPNSRVKQASRNTVARQQRRTRSEAKKTRKRRFYTAGGSLIALALIAGLVLPSVGGGVNTASENNRQALKDLIGIQVEIQPGDVVTDTSSIANSS